MKKTMVFLGFFTATGIVVYWVSVFLGLFKVEDIIPGYAHWFMSFPTNTNSELPAIDYF